MLRIRGTFRKIIAFIFLTVLFAIKFIDDPIATINEITNYLTEQVSNIQQQPVENITLGNIPEYSGDLSIVMNGGVPFFLAEPDEMYETTISYEYYYPLDSLGRCVRAEANLSLDLMPKENENRGDISNVKPSGWWNKPYDFVEGGYLYNRCHLIAYMLAGENDNKMNLITGTRYFNATGMLPYEEKVSRYIHNTNNHVLYRVTPIYTGDNLVANGVVMEAYSVEDDGEGLQFCVFVYNVQPGVVIDYKDGNNWEAGYSEGEEQPR